MKHIIIAVLFLSTFICFTSCYKSDESSSEDDLDLVLSARNTEFNFQNPTTFTLIDSIVSLSGSSSDDLKRPLELQNNIINRVREKLINVGYTEEIDPQNNVSDLVFLLQSIDIDRFGLDVEFPFWENWGWFDWSDQFNFEIGNTLFRSFPYVVNRYNTGTLFIVAFSPKEIRESSQIEIQWLVTLNGVISTDDSNVQQRAFEGIDQAFSQSPYITK